jgi:hypothetical protein
MKIQLKHSVPKEIFKDKLAFAHNMKAQGAYADKTVMYKGRPLP